MRIIATIMESAVKQAENQSAITKLLLSRLELVESIQRAMAHIPTMDDADKAKEAQARLADLTQESRLSALTVPFRDALARAESQREQIEASLTRLKQILES